MNRYQQELEKRKHQQLLRKLTNPEANIDFYSNDYLGLARSERLYKKITREYDSLLLKRTGSTGSRLLSGNSLYAEEIEHQIAFFHRTESALLFNSGYSANVGLISALGSRGVNVISDEFIHASMIDGLRLSHAARHRFKHNNLEDLEIKLSKLSGEKVVLIESIYSMDGDIAPLEDILVLCKKYDAELIVDEAHSIGVAGNKGEGMCSNIGIQNEVLAIVVTFSKAMGTHGAAVLGKKWVKEYLINFARSFIYSTAMSDHQLTSIKCAYDMMNYSFVLRTQLLHNIDYFNRQKKKFNQQPRSKLTRYEWAEKIILRGKPRGIKPHNVSKMKWGHSNSAIQSLIIPGNEAVMKMSEQLDDHGMTSLPIRSPTIPNGEERLRISLHAYNTEQEIDLLFKVLVL